MILAVTPGGCGCRPHHLLSNPNLNPPSFPSLPARTLPFPALPALSPFPPSLPSPFPPYRDSSISVAPPPATTAWFLMARRTIMMASCSDRSTSSMNWSAPPRSKNVHVLAPGQPAKMLNLCVH